MSTPDPEDAPRPRARGPFSTDVLAAILAALVLLALLVTALFERPTRRFRAEPVKSPTPAQSPPTPLPAVETDFATGRTFLPLGESEVGRLYAVSPKDLRALRRVARLGGYESPEAMAATFGYPSVDRMLDAWNQSLAARGPTSPGNRRLSEMLPPTMERASPAR